jgi:hypothetical protein
MADKPAKDWTDKDIDDEAKRRKDIGAPASLDDLKLYLSFRRRQGQDRDRSRG